MTNYLQGAPTFQAKGNQAGFEPEMNHDRPVDVKIVSVEVKIGSPIEAEGGKFLTVGES